jgi:hypothetical protein
MIQFLRDLVFRVSVPHLKVESQLFTPGPWRYVKPPFMVFYESLLIPLSTKSEKTLGDFLNLGGT